jgi:predicted nuclease with TOPRIM domain
MDQYLQDLISIVGPDFLTTFMDEKQLSQVTLAGTVKLIEEYKELEAKYGACKSVISSLKSEKNEFLTNNNKQTEELLNKAREQEEKISNLSEEVLAQEDIIKYLKNSRKEMKEKRDKFANQLRTVSNYIISRPIDALHEQKKYNTPIGNIVRLIHETWEDETVELFTSYIMQGKKLDAVKTVARCPSRFGLIIPDFSLCRIFIDLYEEVVLKS